MSNFDNRTTNIPMANNAFVRHVQTRQLIRSTAWQQIQNEIPKEITPEQFKRNQEALIMLSLVAAGYKFCDELITELDDAGMYRHNIKRLANQVEPVLKTASTGAMKVLKRVNGGTYNTGYFDAMDSFYEAIDNCVALAPPERIYNILLSICRLVGKYSQKLTEYKRMQSHEAVKVVKILQQIPIHDYDMDNIIELTVKPLVFNRVSYEQIKKQ